MTTIKRPPIRDFLGILILLILIATAASSVAAEDTIEVLPDLRYALAFVGIFLGIFCRTALPFLEKAGASKEPFVFQYRYIATALSVLMVAFIASMFAIQMFQIPTDVASGIALIFSAYIFGWGSNDVTNTLVVDMRKKRGVAIAT